MGHEQTQESYYNYDVGGDMRSKDRIYEACDAQYDECKEAGRVDEIDRSYVRGNCLKRCHAEWV